MPFLSLQNVQCEYLLKVVLEVGPPLGDSALTQLD